MKKVLLFSAVLLSIFIITSCTSLSYYQVYDTKSDEVNVQGEAFKYEDEIVIINYNLWKDKGDIGFYFFNKTDSVISIDLSKSYYVVNGTAFDYYQQRTSTNSFTNNTNHNTYYYNYYYDSYVNNVVTLGSSRQVSYHEKRVVNIPPQTGKSISEYNIVRDLYRDCNLIRFPNKKTITSSSFNEENTPLTFYNYLTYTFSGEEKVVKNNFWVSKITNYTKDQVIKLNVEEYCGEESTIRYPFFIVNEKNRFYFKYSKPENTSIIFSH